MGKYLDAAYYRKMISEETNDNETIEHDVAIVNKAHKLGFCDSWDEVVSSCVTETAKKILQHLEMLAYRKEERGFS